MSPAGGSAGDTGADGTAYLTGTDNLGNPWQNAKLTAIAGLPQAVPISSYTAIVARTARGALHHCLAVPKEAQGHGWEEIPGSSGLRDWASFYLPPEGYIGGPAMLGDPGRLNPGLSLGDE